MNVIDRLLNIHETDERLMFGQREALKARSPLSMMQEVIDAVLAGDLRELRKLSDKIQDRTSGISVGSMSANPLRNMQYFAATFTHLVCYKCIECGLNQDIAYNYLDEMMRRVDTAASANLIVQYVADTLTIYVGLMRDLRAQSRISRPVEQCIDYIDLHLHRTIALSELARVCNLSPSYLSRLFHRETGRTVSEYILRKKIAESAVMLREHGLDGRSVAYILEFSSQSYFIAQFKRIYGVTPRVYCRLSDQERDALKRRSET